jgi:hypothetical protein
VPLFEHYTIDIDALLARASKLAGSSSIAKSPPSGASASAHALFTRVRGRQIELASEELLMQIMDAVCSTNDSSTNQRSESASIVIHRLIQAATIYNSSAAQHLSEDLKAASDSICSSMFANQTHRLILINI